MKRVLFLLALVACGKAPVVPDAVPAPVDPAPPPGKPGPYDAYIRKLPATSSAVFAMTRTGTVAEVSTMLKLVTPMLAVLGPIPDCAVDAVAQIEVAAVGLSDRAPKVAVVLHGSGLRGAVDACFHGEGPAAGVAHYTYKDRHIVAYWSDADTAFLGGDFADPAAAEALATGAPSLAGNAAVQTLLGYLDGGSAFLVAVDGAGLAPATRKKIAEVFPPRMWGQLGDAKTMDGWLVLEMPTLADAELTKDSIRDMLHSLAAGSGPRAQLANALSVTSEGKRITITAKLDAYLAATNGGTPLTPGAGSVFVLAMGGAIALAFLAR